MNKKQLSTAISDLILSLCGFFSSQLTYTVSKTTSLGFLCIAVAALAGSLRYVKVSIIKGVVLSQCTDSMEFQKL